MKRKDWKIKNLKKDIFGKKKKFLRIRERFLFLRKLFLRQNRYLIKKNLFINYIFYKEFLNSYKKKKQNYYYNIIFKTNVNVLKFLPEYSIIKNVFNKKIKFKELENKNKIKLIFLSNKYTKNNFGLNYYVINNNISLFLKDLNDENYQNLLHLKNNEITTIKLKNEFNFYFNYNLYFLSLLEIYKIMILLTLKEVIK